MNIDGLITALEAEDTYLMDVLTGQAVKDFILDI